MKEKDCKIIGITNQKGGVAKTTTAIEICTCLTNLKKKVLLIDMDQQCDATNSSGLKIENTIDDIFKQNCDIMSGIQHTDYYDLISGSPTLSKADQLYAERDDVYYLSDICDLLKPLYDYIIIDNPPSRSVIQSMTLIASDYIIVPVLNDENSLKGIASLDADLKKLRNGRNAESHAFIRGIILTKSKPNTIQHLTALNIINDFAAKQNPECFVSIVRDSTAVSECKSYHVPLQAFDKTNNAAIDYQKIAKMIVRMK